MTGSIIPKSFDTIIPIEQINFYPNKKKPKYILINKKIKNINTLDLKVLIIKKGDLLIKKGTILQSNHILALKSLGINFIKVKKNLIYYFFLQEMKFQIKKDFRMES